MLSLGLFVSLVVLTVSVTGSSDGNPLDNDKWMSTVSQYDKSKYWNKFRDVSFSLHFLVLLGHSCVCFAFYIGTKCPLKGLVVIIISLI